MSGAPPNSQGAGRHGLLLHRGGCTRVADRWWLMYDFDLCSHPSFSKAVPTRICCRPLWAGLGGRVRAPTGCFPQHPNAEQQPACSELCTAQFGFQEPGTNEEIKKFAAGRGFTGALQVASSVDLNCCASAAPFVRLTSWAAHASAHAGAHPRTHPTHPIHAHIPHPRPHPHRRGHDADG